MLKLFPMSIISSGGHKSFEEAANKMYDNIAKRNAIRDDALKNISKGFASHHQVCSV